MKGNFQKVSLKSQNRAGVITHPYLLTNFAYHNSTSPIHRGVFLTRNIVGMSLKAPPEANVFEESKFDPSLTMREKVTEMTRAKACMACHYMINPLGFSMEHFDGIGRFRQKEKGTNKPINDDGKLPIDGGKVVDIKGPRDVAEFAANDLASQRGFVRQLYQFYVKETPSADTLNELQKQFTDSGCNIQLILVKIALASLEDKK